MLESLLHILGICPDHFTHVNLLDLLVYGPFALMLIKIKGIYYYVKGKLKK